MLTTNSLVTAKVLNDANISLHDALLSISPCQMAMKVFGVHQVSVIESIIKKLDIPYSSLFSLSNYKSYGSIKVIDDAIYIRKKGNGTIISRERCSLYLHDAPYSSLSWEKIYVELFKRYYADFYEDFSYYEDIVIDNDDKVRDIISKYDLGKLTWREFKRFMNQKNKIKRKSYIKLYSATCSTDSLFFVKVPNTEHSIYLRFNDLLRLRRGAPIEDVWQDICERVWYIDRVQGDEEWFQSIAPKLMGALMKCVK